MSFYELFELNHAALAPWRAFADATRAAFQSPGNPFAETPFGRSVLAAADLFERTTRRYGKPAFGLVNTEVDGQTVDVTEEIVWQSPFCSLLHFHRELPAGRAADPKLLLVAPMSGHHATLLRGTVEALLPGHDVYVTDWADARNVSAAAGRFDLDGYIDAVTAMIRAIGPGAHVMAVCQPSVPVLAAVSLMSEDGDAALPASMTLIGGPVDTRVAPTEINRLAKGYGIDWFRENAVMTVPATCPGGGRVVYPGFMQLSGFLGMHLDRHVKAYGEMFAHLVQGDGESVEKHREFYDEFLAVMDLTAEFYLQTIETVFIEHLLPRGLMTHRGRPIRPEAISGTALFTIEGERDDISAPGQTEAAHALCSSLPATMRDRYLQPGVGHYGVFNGSRYREEIVPRIAAFVRRHEPAEKPGRRGGAKRTKADPR
ncbi:poly(3-hydroxybutyrate) depolymerase [Faunimonas pinastri]|uniref:Poly(3-hydroxybutyrate) depolymerase n=1 Tax=Faunimonas pinastri TaxID=1855383 RepID=A0A1H9PSP7_9HYPH|nr:polyhydroxyalkanoate depolymerase [Faunimonas pinastri]SER51212.1 poly(3-hydroxybutyrate) depolymerase [Faunimonas pinastri]